jgi:hypothetical protein
MASLKAVVLAGPDPAVDQIGRWWIVDLCRYVEERWEVSCSETGMLRLIERAAFCASAESVGARNAPGRSSRLRRVEQGTGF